MMKEEVWRIGTIIRRLREEQNITQSQLGLGICSVSTINRIETNERNADMMLAIRIFQRLGYNLDKFELYGSNEEFMQYNQRILIEKYMRNSEIELMQNALIDYQVKWKKWIDGDPLQRQYVMAMTGILERYKGNVEGSIRILEKAIAITIPNFNKDWSMSIIIGGDELQLFNFLADAYDQAKENILAFEMRKKILDYLDFRDVKAEQIINLYTDLICKLAPEMIKRENAKSCLELCERGLLLLSKSKRLFNWPNLLYWRGKCIEIFYQSGIADYGEMIEALQKSYYIYDLFEDYSMAGEVYRYLKETYGWECIE